MGKTQKNNVLHDFDARKGNIQQLIYSHDDCVEQSEGRCAVSIIEFAQQGLFCGMAMCQLECGIYDGEYTDNYAAPVVWIGL